MTTTDAPVVLRTPGWARLAAVAVLASALVVNTSAVPPEDRLFLYVLAGALALFLAWSARVGVVATADGRLVVRNLTGTLTVPREHVASVEIDDAGPTGQAFAIFVRTHEDLRFRLDVTVRLFPRPLERQAVALRDWRDGRPQPLPWEPREG